MTETPQRRLQHVVLMRFPSDLDRHDDADLRGIVLSLPGEIDELLACRFGSDLDGSRTRGYQYLLFTEFADNAALASYVAHPAHQVLIRWLDDHECQRLAFDYYLDGSTDAFA
jgi:stress responsive alpha/beta barrel protein